MDLSFYVFARQKSSAALRTDSDFSVVPAVRSIHLLEDILRSKHIMHRLSKRLLQLCSTRIMLKSILEQNTQEKDDKE